MQYFITIHREFIEYAIQHTDEYTDRQYTHTD